MRHIYRMYKFTQYVDKADKEAEKHIDKQDRVNYEKMEDVVKMYAEVTGRTRTEVWDILNSGIENKYLKTTYYKTFIHVDPGRGRQFLDKLWIFPLGFWEEILNTYGNLTKLIISGVLVTAILTVTGVAWRIIRLMAGVI